MSIAATQMYRGLDEFFSSDVYDFYSFTDSQRFRHLSCTTEFIAHTYRPPITLVPQSKLQGPGVGKPHQFRSMGYRWTRRCKQSRTRLSRQRGAGIAWTGTWIDNCMTNRMNWCEASINTSQDQHEIESCVRR